MKTAIQQCAQDLFETNLSHESKTIVVDILHKHLTTEKEQIVKAFNSYTDKRREAVTNGVEYYNETFDVFHQ